MICASGQRAAVGASLVQRFGAPRGAATWSTAASARGAAPGLPGRALASTHGSPTPARSSRLSGTTLRQASDEVELYHRTYTTLLRSSGETLLRVLEPSHAQMGSSLHSLAHDMEQPDLGAFLYSLRRLPASIWKAQGDRRRPGVGGVRARRASGGSRTGRPSRRPPAGAAGTTPARARSPSCSPRPRTSTTRSRRSSPTSSSGTSCTRCCARAEPAAGPGAARRRRRVSAAPRRTGRGCASPGPTGSPGSSTRCATRKLNLRLRMLGGSQSGYARLTRRWWAPVRADADRPGALGPPDVLRLLEPALAGEPA